MSDSGHRRDRAAQYRSPAMDEGGAGPQTAFLLARRTFIAGERIDMQKLVAELGVDRSTLFRWVGNRDQLLAQLLWSLAEPTLATAVESSSSYSGAERIAHIMGDFAQALIEAPYFRVYLRREPERALRLLTTRASQLQRNMVNSVERLIERELDRGSLAHYLSPHDLAFLIVRIAESFIYTDMITGEIPDSSKTAAAVAALLS